MAVITSAKQPSHPHTETRATDTVNGKSTLDTIVNAVDQELAVLTEINSVVWISLSFTLYTN